MKVYLATTGEYSDYRVVHVFAREEDARAYLLAGDVEEYELQEGPVEVRSWHHLRWVPGEPDTPQAPPGLPTDDANPCVWSDLRDFDGHPKRVEHTWRERRWGKILLVEGWDLERVRKVYSEQRAQHIARQDMGVEPCGDQARDGGDAS